MKDALVKGLVRFKQFQKAHKDIFGHRFTGRLLEFGCGAGGFLLQAAKAGIDVQGVEVKVSRKKEYNLNANFFLPSAASRFNLYDGRLLPFDNNIFDGCYSWFVLEHVSDPELSLREIIRVLKPSATISIFSEDVRSAWDGHLSAPWPPYLPKEFTEAYLEGLGQSNRLSFIRDEVFSISATFVAEVLTTLGCDIIYKSSINPHPLSLEGLQVSNEREAFDLGKKVRLSGCHQSPIEILKVFARKH